MAKSVRFGLSKAHYAVYDESTNTYGEIKPLEGAVSLTLTAEGDESTFYADDIAYYTQNSNTGTSGELKIADMPAEAYIDLLGQEYDANGILVEGADDKQHTFALLYEVQGNIENRRFAFYNCTLARPDSEAQTKEEQVNPATDTMKIRMIPRVIPWGSDTKNLVKASVTNATKTKTQYDNWYNEVYIPTKANA